MVDAIIFRPRPSQGLISSSSHLLLVSCAVAAPALVAVAEPASTSRRIRRDRLHASLAAQWRLGIGNTGGAAMSTSVTIHN